MAAAVLAALLVTLDLAGVGRRYFNEEVLTDAQSVDDAVPEYDFDRYLVDRKEAEGGNGHFRVLSLEGQQHPSQVARPAYFYESLGGYHGAKLRVYQDYLEHILFDSETGLPDENGLDLLNTRYVVAQGQLPGAEPVFKDERTGYIVNERKNALPRAYFVGDVEVIESPQETWERIQSTAFDPAGSAILSEAFDQPLTPIDSSSTVEVQLQSHSPHQIVWQVQTDAPRLLVVSEIYYPAGWHATIDGEETAIYRVDYLLRGVAVPEGEHEIVMQFEPASYRIGYWVSASSTLIVYGGIIGLIGAAFLRKRKREEDRKDAEGEPAV
jgi:hypothetical protein